MKGRRIAENMKWSGRAVLPFFGALAPDQISVPTCDKYTEMRTEAGRHPGTIHTELGHLRMSLVWATKRKMIESAPYIRRPTKPTPVERWLTRDEIIKLIDAAKEPHTRLAIILLVTTAARTGAILDLTWDRVDFDLGVIDLRIPNDASRKGRAVVPMNTTSREALEQAQPMALTGYVIERGGKPVKSIKKGFASCVDRAGISKATPHDLRRSAARMMAEGGRSMIEISQFLGHSDQNTTYHVYARFSPDHMREAAEILDFEKHKAVHRTKKDSA